MDVHTYKTKIYENNVVLNMAFGIFEYLVR